jgi:hypothetical protein
VRGQCHQVLKFNFFINMDHFISSARRALLYNIIPPFRLISIYYEGNEETAILSINIYTDRELSSDEKDICYSIWGEMEGDALLKNPIDLNIIVIDMTNTKVIYKGLAMYARYEGW